MWFLERLPAPAEVICAGIYRITPKIGIHFRNAYLLPLKFGRATAAANPPWESLWFRKQPVDSSGMERGKSSGRNDLGPAAASVFR
ncbi:MAG: hypothetical protein QM636_06990 [Rhizobium sp.]